MTTKLILASLLLPALAVAQPRPPMTCSPTGDVLFTIEVKDGKIMGNHGPMSTVKVYDNGAWTLHDANVDGTTKRDARDCLDPKALQTIKDDLKAMSWKIDTTKAHCMTVSSGLTEYSVHGKVMFTARTCGDTLTDADTKKFDEIMKLVDGATHPAVTK